MATRDKNIWILIVFILAGLVIGGLIGQFAAKMDSLWWLAYGESFGLSEDYFFPRDFDETDDEDFEIGE